ncbi:MAG: hypothetical protein WKF34_07360 [Pyrinomonadaceae bacterium]
MYDFSIKRRVVGFLGVALALSLICSGCASLSDAARVSGPDYGWKIKESSVEFLTSEFLSPTLGYAIASRESGVALFRTSDGGDSWQPVSTLSGIRVIDLDFFNPNVGLMVVETYVPDRKQRILRSTDQGRSWLPVFESASTQINELALSKANGVDAIAVGSTIDESRPPYLSSQSSPVLLLTSNQGTEWRDESGSISATIGEKEIFAAAMMSVQYGCLVLTSNGRLLSRSSGSDKWSTLLSPKSRTLTFYPLGAFNDGDPWIIGGTGAIEGVESSLGVFDGSWSFREMEDWYITDAISIGEEGIMVSGRIGTGGNLTRAGIYFSSDRGRKWSVVHEVEDSSVTFAPLVRVSKDRVLTGNGLIIYRKPE